MRPEAGARRKSGSTTRPPGARADRFESLVRVVLARSTELGEQPCLRFHRDGSWQDLSWATFGRRITAIAAGLRALDVEPGDRVALVSENRPEWALADLGSIAAGAVVVPVYATVTTADLVYHLAHSRASLAFVENGEQAARIDASRKQLPHLRHLVVLSPPVPDLELASSTLGELETLVPEAGRVRAITPGLDADASTPLSIIYTSGTTGRPKGVILTHGNVIAVLQAVLEVVGGVSSIQLSLSFLPLAHALERVAGHMLPLYAGGTIAYARGLAFVAEDLLTIRPQVAVAVPRVFEKIHARIMTRATSRPAPLRALVAWAMEVGRRRSELLETGRPIPAAHRLAYWLADLVILRRIRAAFGGRMHLFVSGGAPLVPEIARFFHGAGLLICEGWGATETTAPATWNTPSAYRFGSVGRPLPGVEVMVADSGELLVRGQSVFAGYADNPEATAEAIDAEGWYHTGDIGRCDEDGFFHVTDRLKELIITAGGKNIAPQPVEGLLRQQPIISNAMIWADRRPYVVALVTIDRQWLATAHPELAEAATIDPRIDDLVSAGVEAVNQHLARFEQIKRFAVLPRELSTEAGELTLTLKLRRKVIAETYQDVIEGLYAG